MLNAHNISHHLPNGVSEYLDDGKLLLNVLFGNHCEVHDDHRVAKARLKREKREIERERIFELRGSHSPVGKSPVSDN